VPFEHEPANRDSSLKDKMRAEWPQILGWMLQGCMTWQRDRLGTAKAIAAASSAYFEQQDGFGQWMAERCILDPTGVMQTRPGALYADFKAWCQGNGVQAPSSAEFAETVSRTKGLRRVAVKGVRFIKGIALRPMEDADDRSR
jgi:putative DNA primase/helicase